MTALSDPYELLNVPFDASDAAIQQAFHDKLALAEDKAALVAAYVQIRTAQARENYLWQNVGSLCCGPAKDTLESTVTPEILVRAFAFLTEWELQGL